MYYLGFDADDTLWANEIHYRTAEQKFEAILNDYIDISEKKNLLYETEKVNIKTFGYGAKGFTLSMIETALTITEHKISQEDIMKILRIGKDVMRYQLKLYEGVYRTLEILNKKYKLILITKGDLVDQEWKIRTANIGHLFEQIEIVSEKDAESYANILNKYRISEKDFIMFGNSMRSDILPLLEIGCKAVHIPAEVSWIHEVHDGQPEDHGFYRIKDFKEIPELLEVIAGS